MTLRVILGIVVLTLFTIFFIGRVRAESRGDGKVSGWNIFFLVLAAVLWIALILTFLMSFM